MRKDLCKRCKRNMKYKSSKVCAKCHRARPHTKGISRAKREVKK